MTEETKTISINDKNYPKLLKEIKYPPEVIYYRGELKVEENCFAIVGTRLPSAYGKETAENLTRDLANSGLTIVSGLAPGIDTIAHKTVLEENQRTIAVLGTGLDEESIYPADNIGLARKIVEKGGCLISEYPAGTRGTQFTFPQRNRIISGLSLGVLIIEAKEKSGALITAGWAKKQQRKVFAIPGSIYSSNSKGTHLLIKHGAKLTENANDILEELNLDFPAKFKETFAGNENNEEIAILTALQEQALYIDKIIEKTKLPASTIASTLAILEIKGKVRNLGGNVYALSR